MGASRNLTAQGFRNLFKLNNLLPWQKAILNFYERLKGKHRTIICPCENFTSVTEAAIQHLVCQKFLGIFPQMWHTNFLPTCDSGSVKIPAKTPRLSSAVRNDGKDVREMCASQAKIISSAHLNAGHCEAGTGVPAEAIQPLIYENLQKSDGLFSQIRHTKLFLTCDSGSVKIPAKTSRLSSAVRNDGHDICNAHNRRAAFTLAEVLITLGIIGIIAAMTLPALIQRKQEKVTVNQLKKSYSLLQQVYQRMVFEIGSDPKDWGMSGMYEENSHIIMANKFVPYFKVLQNCIGKDSAFTRKHCVDRDGYSSPQNYASVRLVDGTTLIFRNYSGNCALKYGTTKPLTNVCGAIVVDVNGTKSPNELGQDWFSFYLTNYGIVPAGTQADTRHPVIKSCNLAVGPWGTDVGAGFKNGFGCTAWVLFNENMDYLRCKNLDWGGQTTCK